MSLDDLPKPGLWGEEHLCAEIAAMVLRHCGTAGGELDSGGGAVHAELMTMCEENGLIEITGRTGGRIRGKLFLASVSLRAEHCIIQDI
jgi:hypothetical protein